MGKSDNLLNIWFPPNRIGTLKEKSAQQLVFRYDTSWLKNPKAFALSFSLPLKETLFTQEATHFFGNLLPEGSARENICRKLQISKDNDFDLLKRIGRDCAGALVITAEETLDLHSRSLKKISRKEVFEHLKSGSQGIFDLQIENDLRLSLAGAQNKLPVIYEKGNFYLPTQGKPTTHILKPQPEGYHSLPENEWIHSQILKSLGLPAAESELMQFGKSSVLLVKRYDREFVSDHWQRLHQEDMCQAAGISAKKKYQSEGGPDLSLIIKILEERSNDPLEDIHHVLKWQMLNVIFGNCDAHGKNISLLRKNGAWRLSPFYDVLSTRVYKGLSDKLAMSVGPSFDSGMIHKKHWIEMFKSAGVSPTYYLRILVNLISEFSAHQEKAFQSFEKISDKVAILTEIKKIHHIQLRRVKQGLGIKP